MIEVSKDELGINHVKAYVTEFVDSMGYCEYKIPFFAKGDYVKTEAMIIGGQFHKEAEDFDRETAITEPKILNLYEKILAQYLFTILIFQRAKPDLLCLEELTAFIVVKKL